MGWLVNTGLPPNLFDDNTWLGVDLYAVLTSRSSVLLNNLEPKSSSFIDVRFYGHEDCFSAQVPLALDGIFGSQPHQLVLLHLPRSQFSRQIFGQSGRMWVEFEVNIPDHVAIELCGIRLAYEQNMKGFIDTITECALRSPDVLHPGYYNTFSRLVSAAETEIRAG